MDQDQNTNLRTTTRVIRHRFTTRANLTTQRQCQPRKAVYALARPRTIICAVSLLAPSSSHTALLAGKIEPLSLSTSRTATRSTWGTTSATPFFAACDSAKNGLCRGGSGRCRCSGRCSSEAVLDTEDATECAWVSEGVGAASRVDRLVVLRWERRIGRVVEPPWNWER